MVDLFICPYCNQTTSFEGAPVGERVTARTIECKCNRTFLIVVNYGCVVQSWTEVKGKE